MGDVFSFFRAFGLANLQSIPIADVRHHTNVLPPEYWRAASEVGMLVQAEFPMFGGRVACDTGSYGIPTPLAPLFFRPLLARFAPSFRRSFAISGFLAPRRRERAKNGVKWAKFGGETAEKQRWLSGVGHRHVPAGVPGGG